MEWSEQWYAWRAGGSCPSCTEGRPDELPLGVRYFAGAVADAYLVRADIQRGLSIVVWRGRHVVEPTELSDEEAAAYGREVLAVGRALEQTFSAVKRTTTCSATGFRICTRTPSRATPTTRARAGPSRSPSRTRTRCPRSALRETWQRYARRQGSDRC